MEMKEALEKMNNLTQDEEIAHSEAEDILLQYLRDLGHGELSDAFEQAIDEIGFWYA